jgi:hypothetical protein
MPLAAPAPATPSTAPPDGASGWSWDGAVEALEAAIEAWPVPNPLDLTFHWKGLPVRVVHSLNARGGHLNVRIGLGRVPFSAQDRAARSMILSRLGSRVRRPQGLSVGRDGCVVLDQNVALGPYADVRSVLAAAVALLAMLRAPMIEGLALLAPAQSPLPSARPDR